VPRKRAGLADVQHPHAIAVFQQPLDEMATDETGAARDERVQRASPGCATSIRSWGMGARGCPEKCWISGRRRYPDMSPNDRT
jgi:hypothetical protein